MHTLSEGTVAIGLVRKLTQGHGLRHWTDGSYTLDPQHDVPVLLSPPEVELLRDLGIEIRAGN